MLRDSVKRAKLARMRGSVLGLGMALICRAAEAGAQPALPPFGGAAGVASGGEGAPFSGAGPARIPPGPAIFPIPLQGGAVYGSLNPYDYGAFLRPRRRINDALMLTSGILLA